MPNKARRVRPFSWLFYFSYSMEKSQEKICQLVGFSLLLSKLIIDQEKMRESMLSSLKEYWTATFKRAVDNFKLVFMA